MPLPNVSANDSEKSYIEKCMIFRSKEKDLTNEDERKRSLAMCFSKFKTDRGIKENASKSMYQIIKEF